MADIRAGYKPTEFLKALPLLAPKAQAFFEELITDKEVFEIGGGGSTLWLSQRVAKLVSLEIPGILYLELAVIERAIPTFSKQITDSSYPLWAIVETTFMGVFPADDTMFTDPSFIIRNKGRAINFQGKKLIDTT